jgi:hypothetical protein
MQNSSCTQVLTAVVKLIQKEVGTPENLKRLRAQIEALCRAGKRDVAARKAELRRRVEQLGAQVAQATKNLALAKSAATFARIEGQVAEWEKERAEAAARLAALEAEGDGAEAGGREAAALAMLERLHEVVEQADTAAVRAALASMVRKVTLKFRPKGRKNAQNKACVAVESLKVELTPDFVNLLGAARRGR